MDREPTDRNDNSEEATPAAVTVPEALSLLGRIKPAAVLALLKDPEFGAGVRRAFSGFQPTARSLANSPVRQRLAQAAAKEERFAAKLKELAETEAKPAAAEPQPSIQSSTQSQRSSPPALDTPDPTARLRAEREARRQERDAARQELAQAKADLAASAKAQVKAEAERDEALRLAAKQAERIARMERQAAKSKIAEARLVKALKEDRALKEDTVPQRPAPRDAGSPSPPNLPQESVWPTAVGHLLDKGKFEAALGLAEDVLKAEGGNLDALQISVRAEEGRREPQRALIHARRLLPRQLQQDNIPAAAETLLTMFRLAVTPESVEPELRQFLAALPVTDSAAVAAARRMLTRLRGIHPGAHDWAASYLAARTVLGPVLMPPPQALGPDDPLPLLPSLGRPLTARDLIEAIDRAQADLVWSASDSLKALQSSDPEAAARLWAALELAAADDPTRLQALRRPPRGAAVVDGSNVAWFDQETLAQGRPRFRHLTAIRRALWQRSFFPVILYADANLPYSIDDKAALRAMLDRRELTLVDAGTVADEVLLRMAKLKNALLITNDKMEDWDPAGEVRRVRYTISPGGDALLLSEI